MRKRNTPEDSSLLDSIHYDAPMLLPVWRQALPHYHRYLYKHSFKSDSFLFGIQEKLFSWRKLNRCLQTRPDGFCVRLPNRFDGTICQCIS